jgi:RNA polymerase primary sigma factor
MAAITNTSSELVISQTTRKARRPHRTHRGTGAHKSRRSRKGGRVKQGTAANDQHDHGSFAAADQGRESWPRPADSFLDAESRDTERPSNAGSNSNGQRDRLDSEKTSFLSMYFRDMSALEVLRPEEEFVTARRIEELDLEVWQQIFSYPPAVRHLTQFLEQSLDGAAEQLVDEFRKLNDAADRARKSNSKQAREQLEIAARRCAGKLHEIDSDRDYLKATLDELERIGRGCPTEVAGGRPRFSPKSRLFTAYLEQVRTAEKSAERVRNDFVRANLRLVVSIARRFNHGRMALADLIQEGNIGLMKAVQRYDYRRGFRFSTYASWWIRHAISRALADKGREVRLPVHMIDAHHKLSKAKRELTSKLGRKPTNDELSEASQIPSDKIEKMRTYLLDQSFSVDRPVNDDDGRSFLEFLRDPRFEDDSLTDTLNQHALAVAVRNALQELKPIEADILRQRFGLDTHNEHTLKQIGEKYNLSRERIRQLQEQALSKVRALMVRQRLAM